MQIIKEKFGGRCQCCGQHIFNNQWRVIDGKTKLMWIPNHAIKHGYLTQRQYQRWVKLERAERRKGNSWYTPVAEYKPPMEK